MESVDAAGENIITMQLNMVVALLATWLSWAIPILIGDDCRKLLEMYIHYLEQQHMIQYDLADWLDNHGGSFAFQI